MVEIYYDAGDKDLPPFVEIEEETSFLTGLSRELVET
jgi:hypothetical protein